MIRPTFVLLSLLCWCANAQAQNNHGIHITIDGSAAQYVLEDPARALEQRDSIWNKFEGYRITRVWHEQSAYPLTWDLWEKRLNKFKDDESLPRNALDLLERFDRLEQREHAKLERHISSYLPASQAFDAEVHFIAFTIPYAFMVERNKIGIEINADEWHNDPECLLNILIHELYHVGHRLNSPDRPILENDPVNAGQFIAFNYAYLFNEGMATHVAREALDLFPSDYKHDDFILLEDENNVRKAFDGINSLLQMTDTEPMEALMDSLWEIGVMQRAYYVAGAFICQSIEERYGKDHLSGLVAKGGLQLVKEYNEIATPGLEITVL